MKEIEGIIADLVSSNERLRKLYEVHLDANDELLAHVFFGDVTRYIVDIAGSKDNLESVEFDRILSYLNEVFPFSSEVAKNVLSVSFLENLEPETAAYILIKSKLSGGLAKELEIIERFYNG